MKTEVNADMKTSELIAIHNSLAATPIKGWKQSKEKLVLRIKDLMKGQAEPVGLELGPASDEPDAARSAGEEGEPRRTVVSRALELLSEVVGSTDAGEPVGMSYDEVLAKIREDFPGAKTSKGSLRWYATKARQGVIRCPRPIPDKRRR